MTKQTTVRLPDSLADDAEAVARVRGDSVNQLIIEPSPPRSNESAPTVTSLPVDQAAWIR